MKEEAAKFRVRWWEKAPCALLSPLGGYSGSGGKHLGARELLSPAADYALDAQGKCAILSRADGQNPAQTKLNNMEDDIICTEKIIADRKTFFLDLKSNARGRVVRITEKVSSNRDRIMVPAEILDDFIAALQDIRKANEEN
ncbi:MAG: hypothetical protein ACI4OS_07360 [Akkermansia sp.]